MTTVHCNEPFCDQSQNTVTAIWKRGFEFDRNWYCSTSCFETALQAEIRKNLISKSDLGLKDRRMRLGPFLINKGMITREQLDLALQRQSESMGSLGECLIELGFCSEASLTAVLSEQQGIPWVGDSNFEISSSVLGLVPKMLCTKYSSFPFEFRSASNELLLAVKSPIDYAFVHVIRKMLDCRVRSFLIQDERFQPYLERYLAGCPQDREEVISMRPDHDSIKSLILGKMNEFHGRKIDILFYGGTFWIRFHRGKKICADLFIRIPELTNIAGLDGKSLPDSDESEARIAL